MADIQPQIRLKPKNIENSLIMGLPKLSDICFIIKEPTVSHNEPIYIKKKTKSETTALF